MITAAIQMCSTPDVAHNLTTAVALIAEAAQAGAELVALPEYFCLMGMHDLDKLSIAETLTDTPTSAATPIQLALSQAAQKHGIWLVAGTVPIRAPQPNKVFNTTLVYNPQGQRVAHYDKIHLFCFDDGDRRYDESIALQAGNQTVAFDLTDRHGDTWRVGLGICYDLRFPELFRQLSASQALDLIVLPAAFTDTTGRAHWELLLRARAVENLCHVLAPAQGGTHENGRSTFGHTMAIGPWGNVLAMREQGVGVVLAQLDRDEQHSLRTQLPALQHRVLN